MDGAISILSGGLDSVVGTALAKRHLKIPTAVTFDYGQRASIRECEAGANVCKKWGIDQRVIRLDIFSKSVGNALTNKSIPIPEIDVNALEKDPAKLAKGAEAVWVPNRNGIFINIAAGIAEAEGLCWIITGFNKEEAATFPDNSRNYIELVNKCLKKSTRTHPNVRSYVTQMDKTEILKTALELDVDITRLWFCYDGEEKWCGRCESCARTIRAMKNLDIFQDYKECFQ